MSQDEYVRFSIDDFSDQGIGRAILDFIQSHDPVAVNELVEEAAKRNIPFPEVEVRNEAPLYELIAAVAGAIERSRASSVSGQPIPVPTKSNA
jgi:hypothetical protein